MFYAHSIDGIVCACARVIGHTLIIQLRWRSGCVVTVRAMWNIHSVDVCESQWRSDVRKDVHTGDMLFIAMFGNSFSFHHHSLTGDDTNQQPAVLNVPPPVRLPIYANVHKVQPDLLNGAFTAHSTRNKCFAAPRTESRTPGKCYAMHQHHHHHNRHKLQRDLRIHTHTHRPAFTRTSRTKQRNERVESIT